MSPAGKSHIPIPPAGAFIYSFDAASFGAPSFDAASFDAATYTVTKTVYEIRLDYCCSIDETVVPSLGTLVCVLGILS